jgi:hypothetical protein
MLRFQARHETKWLEEWVRFLERAANSAAGFWFPNSHRLWSDLLEGSLASLKKVCFRMRKHTHRIGRSRSVWVKLLSSRLWSTMSGPRRSCRNLEKDTTPTCALSLIQSWVISALSLLGSLNKWLSLASRFRKHWVGFANFWKHKTLYFLKWIYK